MSVSRSPGLILWCLDVQIVCNIVPCHEERPKIGNLLICDDLITDAESTSRRPQILLVLETSLRVLFYI